jgi:hypothetical protein
MTTESINAYQQAKQAAQTESKAAQQVINNAVLSSLLSAKGCN